MVQLSTTILKFDKQGEKSGWTYILIPGKVAAAIKNNFKKSFRVKGKLDHHKIKQVALLPMGEGDFILPINAAMRKAIGKKAGASILVQIEEDKEVYQLNTILLECLQDEPRAMAAFNAMPASHQRYYSKWIDSAKTEATKTKRIAMAVSALAKKLDFGTMLRMQNKQ